MEAGSPRPTEPLKGPNPWKFVPILYILQAIPVVFIQDVTAIMFKDLGVPNDKATMWVSLLAVPWSLQIVLGPLVELSSKRRNWVIRGQILMTLLFALLPFLVLATNQAVVVSVAYMFGMGILSALVNIATDGFYILSLSKDVQSAFVGLQSAFFRLGRMVPSTLILIIVGQMMAFNPVKVTTMGNLYFAYQDEKTKEIGYLKSADFHLKQGQLTTQDGKVLLDAQKNPISVPGNVNSFEIQNGGFTAGGQGTPLGLYQLNKVASDDPAANSFAPTTYPTGSSVDVFTGATATRRMSTPVAWMLGLFALFGAYALLVAGAAKLTPHAASDTEPTEQQRSELGVNIVRSVFAVGAFLAIFYGLTAGLKALVNGIAMATAGKWIFPDDTEILSSFNFDSPIKAELTLFAGCLVGLAVLIPLIKKQLKGSEMGASLGAFFRQPGIIAILCFMLFYRFAEAMVNRISPVFLKDDLVRGGLALSTDQVGWVKGTIGPLGIILGGIVGGLLVKQVGLKKGFWVIAIIMHIPILLYLGAAIVQPRSIAGIGTVEFIDQFGYGVGYSGYAVFLMRIAQRGNYPTSHYAVGAGLGAAIIVFAGGVASSIFSAATPKDLPVNGHAPTYVIAFTVALLCAIPGLLTLIFLPKEASEEQPQPA